MRLVRPRPFARLVGRAWRVAPPAPGADGPGLVGPASVACPGRSRKRALAVEAFIAAVMVFPGLNRRRSSGRGWVRFPGEIGTWNVGPRSRPRGAGGDSRGTVCRFAGEVFTIGGGADAHLTC